MISLRLVFGVTHRALAAVAGVVYRLWSTVAYTIVVHTEIRSIVTFRPALQVAVMQQPRHLAVACSIRFWRLALFRRAVLSVRWCGVG